MHDMAYIVWVAQWLVFWARFVFFGGRYGYCWWLNVITYGDSLPSFHFRVFVIRDLSSDEPLCVL